MKDLPSFSFVTLMVIACGEGRPPSGSPETAEPCPCEERDAWEIANGEDCSPAIQCPDPSSCPPADCGCEEEEFDVLETKDYGEDDFSTSTDDSLDFGGPSDQWSESEDRYDEPMEDGREVEILTDSGEPLDVVESLELDIEEGPDVGFAPTVQLVLYAGYDGAYGCIPADVNCPLLPKEFRVLDRANFVTFPRLKVMDDDCEYGYRMRMSLDGETIFDWSGPMEESGKCESDACIQCGAIWPWMGPILRVYANQVDYGPHVIRGEVWIPELGLYDERSVTFWTTRCKMECVEWLPWTEEAVHVPELGGPFTSDAMFVRAYLNGDRVAIVAQAMERSTPTKDLFLVGEGRVSDPIYPTAIRGIVRFDPFPVSVMMWRGTPFAYDPATATLISMVGVSYYGFEVGLGRWSPGGAMTFQWLELPGCWDSSDIGMATDAEGTIHFIQAYCHPETLYDVAFKRGVESPIVNSYYGHSCDGLGMNDRLSDVAISPNGVIHVVDDDNLSSYFNTFIQPIRCAAFWGWFTTAFWEGFASRLLLDGERMVMHQLRWNDFDATRVTMNLDGTHIREKPSTDVFANFPGGTASGGELDIQTCGGKPLSTNSKGDTLCLAIDATRDSCGREWLVTLWGRSLYVSDNRSGEFRSELLKIFNELPHDEDEPAIAVDSDQNILVAYRDPATRHLTVARRLCAKYVSNKP